MDILEKYNEDKDKSGTGVQFQKYRAERYYPDTPKMIQWVMKYSGGLIKGEKQASYVLIGFAAVVLIIALVLIFGGSSSYKERINPPIPAAGPGDPNFNPQ